jgi:hypothetical protein
MKRMDNQDELNFRRFEEIYPVYRDMGRKVKAEFQKAKEIDLFNTKENQSLKDRIKELENLPQGLLQLEATLGHVQELEGLMRKHGHHLDLYKDELVKILGTKNAFVMIDELLTTKDRQQK